MGFIAQLFRPSERRSVGDDELSMGAPVAGPMVTAANALQSATVYACVQVLAGSVAQMPLKLYRRLERGKEPAPDHPLYFLLHDRPNPEMSDYTFKETLMHHLLLWGNAYAEIEWGKDGYPVALWPLLPDRIEVKRARDGSLVYVYKPNLTRAIVLPAWRVLHIPGLGFDGLVGYSPIRLQMQTLSGDRAVNEYGWRFFRNGARPGVVLKHPSVLKPEAAARLKASWNEAYGGVENAHRVAVLEEGVGLETIGIPPEEAQFLQTKQFTQRQIAAFFRVPPQLIGDHDATTYASAEQFSADFVKFTLGEWLRRWEAQIALRLLVGDEAQTLVPEFVRDALIITQTSERFSAYSTAITSGVLTMNEARERENLNPLPGGDELLRPLNMTAAGGTVATNAADGGAAALADTGNNGDALDATAKRDGDVGDTVFAPLLADAQRRLTARINNDVRQAGAKALRQGGQLALDVWGDAQMSEWRLAGEKMTAATVEAATALGVTLAPDVDAWVGTAYDDAVGQLIDGE